MLDFDFIALDVETANEEFWSVCQIGLAFFKEDALVDSYYSYVNPETYFNEFNIQLHGITPELVKNSMKLKEFHALMELMLSGQVVVHHTAFDKISLRQISQNLGVKEIDCEWLDSAIIARRTWSEVRQRGYGLVNLSEMLNIPHEKPHDALDDAITAGFVLRKAIKGSNKTFDQWRENAKHHYSLWGTSKQVLKEIANAEPDPSGILFGEVIVFTGALSITRIEAAKLAYQLGCNVDEGVTQKTTILVVGDQDIKKLAGYEKSSKQRKAEKLMTEGKEIRIINEEDFLKMVDF